MAATPGVLKDVLTSARSKNAGPFSVSFDLFFPDLATFEMVRDNNVYRWAGSMLQDAARLRKRVQIPTAAPAPEPDRLLGDNVVRIFERRKLRENA